MLMENGRQKLQEFDKQAFPEAFDQVAPGIWHVTGLGHSNAIVVEGRASVLLIDTLDTYERGERLLAWIRKEIGKPVKTIIYTHGHPDHRGGAGALTDSQPEIVAFAPRTPALDRTAWLEDIQATRGARQFGYGLNQEEHVSQGIGRREGMAFGERRAFVPPTTVYQQDKVVREIDGIPVEMVRLPGESDDQIMVWLPRWGALCCGDNYYGCFPNLYAIRGGQYRDIAAWIQSLDVIRSYPTQYLLPGHMEAIRGSQAIGEVLGNFRDAMDFVLTQTLQGMNQGRGPDELAAAIQLPPHYAQLPYLGEFYGCVEWTVRAIYAAYLGWFDGNPTHLHALAPQMRAEKMVGLLGGTQAVLQAIEQAMGQRDYQWCLELCDVVLDGDGDNRQALALKAEALLRIAEYETSANGRHYYIACAKEILPK